MAEPSVVDEKLTCLKARLAEIGSALVAFSGGTDSTLLLSVAREVLGEKVHALIAVAPIYQRSETDRARALVAEMGVRCTELPLTVLAERSFEENPADRCYHCKKSLMAECFRVAGSLGLAHVLEGTNVDDGADYRPGAKAKEESGAISPLADCGFTKAEIRELSRARGLSTWDKPSMACLASRFPYGTEITEDRLRRVEACEELLFAEGFTQCRVRYHGDIARIEVPETEMARLLNANLRSRIERAIRDQGFAYVTVDLKGYRTGSLNEVLEDG